MRNPPAALHLDLFEQPAEGVPGENGAKMHGEREEAMERVRRELRDLLRRGQKITERDLLRLSALTGIDYSTVLRIEQELS
jgi:hypothetical protein